MKHWALKYIGRKWSEEYNCWHFSKEIIEAELCIDAKSEFEAIQNPLCVEQAGAAISESLSLSFWSKVVGEPKPFDICIMGKKDIPHHIGVVVDGEFIIHSNKGQLSSCSQIRLLGNKYRTIEFYRHAKNHTS